MLDDWWLRANAHFDGAWSVAGPHAGQRPLAVPLWALVFGAWSGDPLPGVLLLATAASVFAVCLALLLRRVLPATVALGVAAVWAVLPTHTSLEMWLSCVNIAWSQAAVAAGMVAGWRTERRWWHLATAGACFGFAVLAYEANVVVATLAVLALPWLRDRRLDRPLVAVTGAVSTASLAWVATHWFEGKQPSGRLAGIQEAFVANTAWSFVAPGRTAKLLGVAAFAGLAVAVGRLALPSFRATAGRAEWMMVAGAGIAYAGSVPFALYVYEPLGAGDRVNGLSAVGGALFLVGLAGLVARVSMPAVVVAAAVGLVGAGVARVERTELWHLAGRDADAIVEAAVHSVPDPRGTLVFGPEPIARRKIVAFLERTSIASAVQLAYDDRTVEAEMARGRADFLAAPAELRIDIRAVSALDDR